MNSAEVIQAPSRTPPMLAQVLAPSIGVTGFLWITCANEMGPLWLPLAFSLFAIPWYSYCRWKNGDRSLFPLFPLISGMYFIEYVLPLFWGTGIMKTRIGAKVLTKDALQTAVLLALLGVLAMWAGINVGFGRRFGIRSRIELAEAPHTWNYLRVVLIVGILMSRVGQFAAGAGGRQTIVLFQNIVPVAAFALLYRNYLQGKADRTDKIILVLFTSARFVIGMSSGWLGSFVLFGFVCVAVYIHERRKIPTSAIAGAVLFIIFFQPSKGVFRKTFWLSGATDATAIEKVAYWWNESFHMWSEAPSDPKALKNLGNEVLTRLSLLEFSANVMELTPEVVPFQEFHLYSYLGVTLIPRFIWPEKPSWNEANQWYQVNYGLTERGDLGKVSMAVGFLTEGYISFGWIGTIGVMFFIGMLLDWLGYSLLDKHSGLVLNAIGVALFPSFLAIESQMAQYLSALVQSLGLTLIVMAPAMKVYSRPDPSSTAQPLAVPQPQLG